MYIVYVFSAIPLVQTFASHPGFKFGIFDFLELCAYLETKYHFLNVRKQEHTTADLKVELLSRKFENYVKITQKDNREFQESNRSLLFVRVIFVFILAIQTCAHLRNNANISLWTEARLASINVSGL